MTGVDELARRQRWDLFCSVVDNFGDIGVCWRLSRQLAAEYGVEMRLWVDNLEAFATLCSEVRIDTSVQLIGPIEVRRWPVEFPDVDVADVVIEAFACQLPASYIAAMEQSPSPPIWINLEYLSAESWVEECHLLPSPQPGSHLTKTFFFPGFTPKTGGLLRERGLLRRIASQPNGVDPELRRILGIDSVNRSAELWISLFCYENPCLVELVQVLVDSPGPVRLLAFPGPAIQQLEVWLQATLQVFEPVSRGSLTIQVLPFLSAVDFDSCLRECDVNFVRGEDSFLRAQWVQKPFVWQIYPQADDAHLVKLDAFLARYLSGFEYSDVIRRLWLAWNRSGPIRQPWNEFLAILPEVRRHGKEWADQLDQMTDLANNLVCFVRHHQADLPADRR